MGNEVVVEDDEGEQVEAKVTRCFLCGVEKNTCMRLIYASGYNLYKINGGMGTERF